jgi:hypothetical protein
MVFKSSMHDFQGHSRVEEQHARLLVKVAQLGKLVDKRLVHNHLALHHLHHSGTRGGSEVIRGRGLGGPCLSACL